MRLFLALLMLASGAAAQSDLRVATYNLSFNRSGPGILLKDLQAGEDPQIAAATEVIASVRPDILLLNEFDYDGGNAALEVFRATLAESGLDYPYAFAAPSNTGEPSGIDLNADGEIAGPGDAFGFGQFPGQFGMAVLSRHPIDIEATRTFQTLLWSDLPGALRPVAADGTPFPSEASLAAMRLSSKSHWDVAVETPSGPLRLFASHPTPPVFDGPEDLNGMRNHDEIVFWVRYLDGAALSDDRGQSGGAAETPFVILGDLNADPVDGDGRQEGIGALLAHPRVQDPGQTSAGGAAAGTGGANDAQTGPATQDTADFRDDPGPGNLRVDYALPSAELEILASGVHWPAPEEPGAEAAAAASDHRLVWVDIRLP